MQANNFAFPLTVKARVSLITGSMAFMLVVASVTTWWLSAEFTQTLTKITATSKNSVEAVDAVRSAQAHFKTQVQEWKNILLRGNDPEQFARYLRQFETNETEMRKHLSDLKTRMQGLGVDPGAADTLLAEHLRLGEKYREALRGYRQDDASSAFQIDRSVAGSIERRAN